MSRKIAPYLSAFVFNEIGNDDAPEVTAAWRRELRALLAVARAADRVGQLITVSERDPRKVAADVALSCALDRLSRLRPFPPRRSGG
jgi:hypothetical protein